MTARKLLLTAIFISGSGLNVALAQGGGGFAGSWVFHTPEKPGCPALDVYIARNGSVLGGTATVEGAKKVSRITGSIDGSNKFHMTVTPIDAGAPKGTIDGVSQPDAGVVTAQIKGAGCYDGTRKIRFMPRDMFQDMGGKARSAGRTG